MEIQNEKDIVSEIPSLNNCKEISQIEKGWSSDQKYYLESKEGEKYLLRISTIEQQDVKEKEFRIMKEVFKLGINMSKPLDFGIANNGEHLYILLSWIEGQDVEEVITELTVKEQYNLGVEAGHILKKFHSIPAPADQEDWEERMLKKFDYHQEKYKGNVIKVPNDQYAQNYIKENLKLLKNRPQTFHHGDFHIGNLILTPDKKLGVIDFNRWDYGDPYEEFYKMMIFSREQSVPFARGQLAGYFGDEIPKDFFKVLALYLADVILYSLVWAIPFGEEDINNMLRLAEMIFADFDNFQREVPRWFSEKV